MSGRRRDRISAAARAEKQAANPAEQPELSLQSPLSLPLDVPHQWERLESPSAFSRILHVNISEVTTRKIEYLMNVLNMHKCKMVERALEEWATDQLRRLGIPHGQAVPIHF
jgi:hypothetical protein